jgi:hypothetical protein
MNFILRSIKCSAGPEKKSRRTMSSSVVLKSVQELAKNKKQVQKLWRFSTCTGCGARFELATFGYWAQGKKSRPSEPVVVVRRFYGAGLSHFPLPWALAWDAEVVYRVLTDMTRFTTAIIVLLNCVSFAVGLFSGRINKAVGFPVSTYFIVGLVLWLSLLLWRDALGRRSA